MAENQYRRIAAWSLPALIGLGACAHTQVSEPINPKTPVSPALTAAQSPPSAPTPPSGESSDLEKILSGAFLHFGFDEADLTAESRQRLRAIAGVLRARPTLTVRIAGNCDERGTEEYNLALGERRASAAKKYLANLGIDSNRIETVSYGKDRPAVEGHDERSWAENRRDEFQPRRGL